MVSDTFFRRGRPRTARSPTDAACLFRALEGRHQLGDAVQVVDLHQVDHVRPQIPERDRERRFGIGHVATIGVFVAKKSQSRLPSPSTSSPMTCSDRP